jgi:hypothetical protein
MPFLFTNQKKNALIIILLMINKLSDFNIIYLSIIKSYRRQRRIDYNYCAGSSVASGAGGTCATAASAAATAIRSSVAAESTGTTILSSAAASATAGTYSSS